MLCSIVACGSSAQEWHKTPCDLSIGVNDMFKFGHQPDQLVVVNFPSKFDKTRMDTILRTRPKKMFSHTSRWGAHFSNCEVIKLCPFNGYVRDNLIYSCRTSPMVAISLALKQGAREIVLFGVDFKNHKAYSDSNKNGIHEITTYLKFFKRIEEKGVKIYLGAKETAFDNHLPLYEKERVQV